MTTMRRMEGLGKRERRATKGAAAETAMRPTRVTTQRYKAEMCTNQNSVENVSS